MANNNPDWKCPSCGRWHGPFRFALKCGVCDVALVKKEQKLTSDQIADLEEAAARKALEAAIARACLGVTLETSSVTLIEKAQVLRNLRAIDPAQFRSDRSE